MVLKRPLVAVRIKALTTRHASSFIRHRKQGLRFRSLRIIDESSYISGSRSKALTRFLSKWPALGTWVPFAVPKKTYRGVSKTAISS